MLELKLERAAKLVSGLGGERERWEGSVAVSRVLFCFSFVFEHLSVFFVSHFGIVTSFLKTVILTSVILIILIIKVKRTFLRKDIEKQLFSIRITCRFRFHMISDYIGKCQVSTWDTLWSTPYL